jgi:ribonuclease P protein subunit POP4
MIALHDIVRHELIGLNASIAKSTDPAVVGFSGMVVGETRNMLDIEAGGKTKRFPKAGCTFLFTLPDGTKVSVEGGLLVARPEDRIKKKFRKW